MSDMVERVENRLRALLAQRYGTTICDGEPALARAAIEAMRTPTAEMATIAKGALTGYPRREAIEAGYRAMIDAALAEP